MTEAELDQAVRALMARYRLPGFHVGDSRRSEPGWPDWVICGRGVLYRELKTDQGRLSPDQTVWKYRLQAAGQDWAVWRPADLDSGLIAAQLAAVAFPMLETGPTSNRPAVKGPWR